MNGALLLSGTMYPRHGKEERHGICLDSNRGHLNRQVGLCFPSVEESGNRVGGAGRPPLLSHHRTCGSASGGSAQHQAPLASSPCWRSTQRTAQPSGCPSKASPSTCYQQSPDPGDSAFHAHSLAFHSGHVSLFSPSRAYSRPMVLWPRLTPVVSAQPSSRGCLAA